jgi:hypothetical protein
MLEVNLDGLNVLAARCSALAAEVTATSSVADPDVAPGQATATAVQVLHTQLSSAAEALAGGLLSTSEKLAEGGAAFAGHELFAATDLSTVSTSGP